MWTRRTTKKNGDSQAAINAAKESLEGVLSRSEEVAEVAHSLKRARERNHFSEQLYLIITGEEKGRRM